MRTPFFALLLALLFLVLSGCDAAGPGTLDGTPADARPDRSFVTEHHNALTGEVARGRQERLPICHHDAGTESYRRSEVAAPALPAHLRHGDGSPGGEVPGTEGHVFSDACEAVPSEPFTCTVEEGMDGDGRSTLAVTLHVGMSAYLPVTGAATLGSNAQHIAFEWIEEEGARVGRTSTFRQADPAAVSTAMMGLGGPNIPGAFVCGPYEFGVDSGS